MKNFLAERFPVLWNTGLFLVLPLVFLAHISFFCWGYNSLDITIAKGFWWQNIFYHYDKFHFYVNLGITLLLIAIWLFFLLRNEHFKAFYLLPKRRFLAEFLIYWGVILASGILLVSFFYGVKIEVDIFKQEHLEYLECLEKISFPNTSQLIDNIEHFERDWGEYDIPKYSVACCFLALAGTLLLWCYRITGLQITIFTVITIVLMLIALVIFIFSSMNFPLVVSTCWLIYLAMLFSLVFYMKRMNKLLSGIVLNILMCSFFPFVYYGFEVIKDLCYSFDERFWIARIALDFLVNYNYNYYLEGLSSVVFLLFMVFYSKLIYKWKLSEIALHR